MDTATDRISWFPVPDEADLPPELQGLFRKAREKIGFVPNVFRTYAFRPERLSAWFAHFRLLHEETPGLSAAEREMIAVVVSSVNRCYYCLVAHGAAVRKLSGDPELGEMLVMNYRVAELDRRERAMLDFAWKLTESPSLVEEADRQALRDAGFSEEEIWDIGETAAFYNMSNRMAVATDMMPNREYHKLDR